MPTAGSATITSASGEASGPLEKRAAQGLVDEVRPSPTRLRRRVIRTGALAERVIVDFQKVLVEVEPGLRLILADRVPIHFVQNARQRAERRLERFLIRRIIGKQPECGSDQRVRFAQFLRCLFGPGRQRKYLSPARPGVQTSPPARSHRRIAHRPLAGTEACASLVARPVSPGLPRAICSITSSRKRRQRRALIPARLFAVLGAIGVQREEITDERKQGRWRCKLCARRLNVTLQVDDGALKFAVTPQAE